MVQLTDFETVKGKDWLKIEDGDGISLIRASDTILPTNFSSRSNVIRFSLYTDTTVTKRGWSFNWSAVAPGGPKMTH